VTVVCFQVRRGVPGTRTRKAPTAPLGAASPSGATLIRYGSESLVSSSLCRHWLLESRSRVGPGRARPAPGRRRGGLFASGLHNSVQPEHYNIICNTVQYVPRLKPLQLPSLVGVIIRTIRRRTIQTIFATTRKLQRSESKMLR
jgi:hypothetical protein